MPQFCVRRLIARISVFIVTVSLECTCFAGLLYVHSGGLILPTNEGRELYQWTGGPLFLDSQSSVDITTPVTSSSLDTGDLSIHLAADAIYGGGGPLAYGQWANGTGFEVSGRPNEGIVGRLGQMYPLFGRFIMTFSTIEAPEGFLPVTHFVNMAWEVIVAPGDTVQISGGARIHQSGPFSDEITNTQIFSTPGTYRWSVVDSVPDTSILGSFAEFTVGTEITVERGVGDLGPAVSGARLLFGGAAAGGPDFGPDFFVPTDPDVSAVPEPSSLILLGMSGFAGLVVQRRKRRLALGEKVCC